MTEMLPTDNGDINLAIADLNELVAKDGPHPDLSLMNYLEGRTPKRGSWFIVGKSLSVFQSQPHVVVKDGWVSFDLKDVSPELREEIARAMDLL